MASCRRKSSVGYRWFWTLLPSGRRCWQVSTHHPSSPWCASLAASAPADPPQGGNNCFWPWARHRPSLLQDVCVPVAGICGRANLRSAERRDMLIPRTRTQSTCYNKYTYHWEAVFTECLRVSFVKSELHKKTFINRVLFSKCYWYFLLCLVILGIDFVFS